MAALAVNYFRKKLHLDAWQDSEYTSGLFIPLTTRNILIAFRAAVLILISFIFSSSKIIPRTDTTTMPHIKTVPSKYGYTVEVLI